LSVIEDTLAKLWHSQGPEALAGIADARSTIPPRPSIPRVPSRVRKQISISLSKLRSAGYLPEEDQRQRFADYWERIKRPIIQKALSPRATEDLRLILVTSPLPGEGKTFTTLNLALSMARERDISVLLVDADLSRADVSRVLGVQDEPGLVGALRHDKRDVESLVIGTNLPGLEILPAGARVENAAELIASARMREVAARLIGSNPQRLVLFDSPPLLASSQVRALAQIPGQIVVVVRAGQTPRQAVLDAIAHIDKKKLQGLVLNDAYSTSEDGYYGYSAHGATQQGVAKAD
jgi:protein-tyrosine kinase